MLARFLRIANFLKSPDLKVASLIRKFSLIHVVCPLWEAVFLCYSILEISEGLSLEVGLTKLKYHF